ncbi:glycoside hydrolase family 95 protein [Pseudoxanthomonas indica]|uniref:Alpha-L-fucosidase 2 n=1 Tax=Pseudoxanthomonas indica TaxID=428993 RepID=A0A1T5K7C4_9GAMM|nr:glycoside hydrolase family 95 protein [Pseudoxanthomonas indica]GGD47254.1 alpha/beta hydrolase [Pseudoxanthomonas indica]SKC59531.1 alpha-L-fucosidase 2 [Pseudoxanthomonas indica]
MKFSRRTLFQATAAAAAVAGVGARDEALAARKSGATAWPDLQLWYRQPASLWVEALPVGNGRLGAMVYGGVSRERLQLNEDTLYAGGPYTPINPDARAALPKVRELIFAGRYAEAEKLANATMISRPVKQMPYQPLGNLWLEFDGLGEPGDYRRTLDLDSAVATTSFTAGGHRHLREVFVSPVDQCLVVRLHTDDPAGLSGRVRTTNEHPTRTEADGDALLVRGRNVSKHGIEGRLRFAFRVHATHAGGSLATTEEGIAFQGVREVMLRVTAATSFVRFDDVSGDPEAISQAQLASARSKSFEALKKDHLAEHRRLFRRVQLDLGRTLAADLPTDERIEQFAHGNDPALVALYHQYGRYLLISSSRPGTQPANLQGIWNDLMDPPWECKYTINVNTEMNYWPSEANALPECVEPLERMLFELSQTGAVTARDMYGAGGWMAHNNTDLWRVATPPDGAEWALWPMGGAWLLQQLWDRWDYGRDPAYLGKVYPLFKGAAQFFVDTLVTDPQTGWKVTSPSLSPENQHPYGVAICAGPTMDAQILRDLFGQCIEAARLLDTDADFAAQLTALREQLPTNRMGRAGQLMEWQQDWDMDAPEMHHRHISHLYGLHPSSQINRRDTPVLASAAKRTLEIRGDEATGWGTAWRLNFWARLADGEHSLQILKMLLTPKRTYPNLFDAHPPFQIDGNFGGTAGIIEMLVQSWGGTIFLLPALPRDWGDGELRGVKVRNAATLDLRWQRGQVERASLLSERGGDYQIALGEQLLDLTVKVGEKAELRLRDGKLVRV